MENEIRNSSVFKSFAFQKSMSLKESMTSVIAFPVVQDGHGAVRFCLNGTQVKMIPKTKPWRKHTISSIPCLFLPFSH